MSIPAVCTYTAVLGDIQDRLHRPVECEGEENHYIAFSDTICDAVKDGWAIRHVDKSDDPRRCARRLKILSHETFPDAEYTLWVDGCLTPVEEAWKLVDCFLNGADLCVFEHMDRNCVYQELEACTKLKKDDPVLMRKQLRRYKHLGYPYHNGLAETTAVLRRETAAIKTFNELWWSEIEQGSIRDQLSFNYAAWRLGVAYTTFEGTRVSSPHFIWRPHR